MKDVIFDHYREIIPDFPLFLESLRQPHPVYIRINKLKIDVESLLHMLGRKKIYPSRVHPRFDDLWFATGVNSPGKLLEYFLGYIHPQALTSCIVPIILSPEKSSFVLDMCASPGGKTSQLAQMMENTGLLIANELYPDRHIPLANTLARLGVLNTVVTAYQAQEFPMRQRFDFILADVPCSGEGRFRRMDKDGIHPARRDRSRLLHLQKRIILRGFDLLNEQGEMVYATCTYNPEENEAVVDYLLNERNADVLPIKTGFQHDGGLTDWRNEKYDKRLRATVRFYPHRVDSVGFFMARIGRKR
ncbi:MAG: RsmB/NOP family class I SAM-dependent RNA methyltransferase [Deltaproteobacteria bacterium]|nr:RsmB/NOP family class I SAM-dependent RNA methyltransferase [Deltaproteobacteria bacterium]